MRSRSDLEKSRLDHPGDPIERSHGGTCGFGRGMGDKGKGFWGLGFVGLTTNGQGESFLGVSAFVMLCAIVAHRLLRFDLLFPQVGAAKPSWILLGLLVLSTGWVLWKRQLVLRFSTVLAVQGTLFGWALVSRVVSDGTGQIGSFLQGDYAKDVFFTMVLGLLGAGVRRLRGLFATVVLCLVFIAAIAIPQWFGNKACHFFRAAPLLNYEQTTDHRPCQGTAECFQVPRHEQHLRDHNWACERTGPLGLATVIDRIHYVGQLSDPNALGLGLAMATALLLGLATWPNGSRWTWMWFLGLPFLVGAVVLSASRAAQMALVLVFFCFFLFRVGALAAVGMSALASPLMFFSLRNESEATYSTVTRARTYLNGVRALVEEPAFGVGFGNYGRISFLNAHNSFLQAIVETGVLGGTLYVIGICVATKLLLKVALFPSPALAASKDRAAVQHVAKVLLAMLSGVLVCVFFLSLAFDVSWLLPLGFVVAFEMFLANKFPSERLRIGVPEVLVGVVCTVVLLGLVVLVSER